MTWSNILTPPLSPHEEDNKSYPLFPQGQRQDLLSSVSFLTNEGEGLLRSGGGCGAAQRPPAASSYAAPGHAMEDRPPEAWQMAHGPLVCPRRGGGCDLRSRAHDAGTLAATLRGLWPQGSCPLRGPGRLWRQASLPPPGAKGATSGCQPMAAHPLRGGHIAPPAAELGAEALRADCKGQPKAGVVSLKIGRKHTR